MRKKVKKIEKKGKRRGMRKREKEKEEDGESQERLYGGCEMLNKVLEYRLTIKTL